MHRLFLSILFLSFLAFAGPVEDTLRSLIEDGIVGDDELILLIESIDGDAPKNPICDDLAATSIEHQFAQEDLDAVMQSDDVDWDAVREWANEQLDESKRVEKKRQEKREETEVFWNSTVIKQPTISLGRFYGCAIDAQKHVRCWGIEHLVKQGQPKASVEATGIYVTGDQVCWTNAAHEIRCSGSDGSEKLVMKTALEGVQVSTGDRMACQIDSNSDLLCNDFYAPSSRGKWLDDYVKPKSVSVGYHFNCVIMKNDYVECWDIESASNVKPDPPEDLGDVSEISVGYAHACAISKKSELVRCWGNNERGQLEVPEDLGPVRHIFSADMFTCAQDVNYLARCWGLKNMSASDDPFEIESPKDLGPVLEIAVANGFACAIKADSTIQCWGGGWYGQDKPPQNFISILSNEIN